MNRSRLLSLVVLPLFIFSAEFACADAVVGSGVIPYWTQAPGPGESIKGLRMSVGAAAHKEMYGLDIGIVGNLTTSKFVGMGIGGIFNYTDVNATIVLLQLAGVFNLNIGKTEVYGIQLAPGANIHWADSNVYGVQMALGANIAPKTNIYGFQFGLYNDAAHVYGFQLGLINRAKSLHGIQVGLSNYNASGWLAWFPLVNVGF